MICLEESVNAYKSSLNPAGRSKVTIDSCRSNEPAATVMTAFFFAVRNSVDARNHSIPMKIIRKVFNARLSIWIDTTGFSRVVLHVLPSQRNMDHALG
jgi:hypothetical protein